MTVQELLEGFRGYMSAGMSQNSANKYVSYLNTACRDLPAISNHLERIAKSRRSSDKVRYAGEMLSEISGSRLPYKSDCVSAVKKLIDYLEGKRFVGSAGNTVVVSAGAASPVPLSSALAVYENSVPADQKIPGLCELVEAEYVRIHAFAEKLFGGIRADFPYIPVYLSKNCPEKTYYYSHAFLMKKICERQNEGECRPPHCPAAGILEEYHPFTMRVEGTYYTGTEPHIVLYFRNYKKPGMNNPHYEAAVAKTLAHEYMHFLHDYVASQQSVKKPLSDENLSEALADFFGVLYVVERGGTEDLQVANERFKEWCCHDETAWPYSSALHFLPKPRGMTLLDCDLSYGKQKLQKVFGHCTDPRTAKSLLMAD